MKECRAAFSDLHFSEDAHENEDVCMLSMQMHSSSMQIYTWTHFLNYLTHKQTPENIPETWQPMLCFSEVEADATL